MILVYGVTGYTGRLVSQALARSGVAQMVAGRRREPVEAWAREVGATARAFPLEEPDLAGVTAVLNCAGPFARTAIVLAKAAIAARVHYLDLAGEVAEHEAVRALDADAKGAGVMLMPGVGFGVVPTDCAAALAVSRLPSAKKLVIAYETVGGVSRGTLETVLGGLEEPGYVRKDGELVAAGPAERELDLDFGGGSVRVATNAFRADLVSAFHATGVGDIETYATFPAPLRWLMRSKAKSWGSVHGLISWLVARAPDGPSPAERAKGKTRILAIAEDGDRTATVRVVGPEAYDFTATTAAAALARIDQAKPGYQPPSRVFGGELLGSLEGVTVSS